MTISDLLKLPLRVARLLVNGWAQLQSLSEDVRRSFKSTDRLRDEIRDLRREVQDRLLQYHLQLGRFARALDGEAGTETRLSRLIPVDTGELEDLGWAAIGDGDAPPDPEGLEWDHLDGCSACRHPKRTVVSPWNKFILMEKAPDSTAVRYDYAVCHACGILYASRRPKGSRYRFLLEHFGEASGKRGGGAEIRNRVLNPYPLSDADRAELDRLAARGVFVSDHLGLSPKEYLSSLLGDRLDNSVHIDVIGTLVNPRNGRILEIRSRTGTILDGLKRAYGADVYAMPIWESQQYLLRKVYGIQTSDLIDFDNFRIPFDGLFDVIVCNHLFTHIVRPRDFFAELRRRLVPGGYIYLHHESDDIEIFEGKKSILANLNPLHMQTCDQRSLVRALAANGFETIFLKRHNYTHLCLARMGDTQMRPMDDRERDGRIEAYRRAFDRSVLAMDPHLRPRVAAEWPHVVERAVAAGIAEFDEGGNLRLVARPGKTE